MKRPSPLLSRDGSDSSMDSAMTPMIDVVFLLLVFFVWTASFQLVEQILPSDLSSQVGSEPTEIDAPPPEEDFPDVVVRIGWDGSQPQWRLNNRPLNSLDELQNQLAAISGVNSEAPVILFPESIVPLGHVIEAYDTSRLAGFDQISFAVKP